MIAVYDVEKHKFRELGKFNYNDDLTLGVIFLKRESLEIIKNYFIICGYVLIDKKYGVFYPIDIHDDNIVLFEGTYNCMEKEMKKLLIPFLIGTKLEDGIWSSFFLDWQFYLKSDCFVKYGPLIELCSYCLSNSEIIDKMVTSETNIYIPLNYQELTIYTKKLFELFEIKIGSLKCDEKYKYLLQSIINHYHINFQKEDVIKTYYQICKICLDKKEEK